MADNSVFITGAAEGAFTNALNELPGWATETTASAIEKILRKNLNIQTQALRDLVRSAKGRGGAGIGGQGTGVEGANSELTKLIKLLRSKAVEEEKEKKRKKQREKDDLAAAFGVRKFTGTADKARFVMETLSKIGGHVLDANKQYIETHDALYKSGINMLAGEEKQTSSLKALNQIVILTGLRLETLQKVAEKYSSSVNAVGFMKFAKATGLAKENMAKLGFSAAETADLVAAYTDMESNFVDMRGKTERQIAAEAEVFAKQITKTSLALGVSREKLLEQSKALSESTDMSVIEAQSGKEAADNVRAALIGLNPDIANKFMSLVADSGTGLGIMNSTVMDMIKSTSSFSTQMQDMGRDMTKMKPEEFRAKWQDIVNSPAFNEDMKRMQMLGLAGVDGAKSTQQMMAAMKNYVNRVSQGTEAQVARTQADQAAISSLKTEQERMSATAQALFVPLREQIEALTKAMKVLNDATYGLAQNTSVEGRSFVGALAIMSKFVIDTLMPILGGIATYKYLLKPLAGAAGAGAAGAGGGAAAGGAAGGGALARLFPWLMKGSVGAGLLFHSGELNANEDAELAKRRAMGPTIDNTQISVPKTPAQSTINSPSAVPADSKPATDTSGSSPAAPTKSIGAGIEKPSSNTDINTSLAFQNSLLQQILLTSEKLVSVNSDILRYTKIT